MATSSPEKTMRPATWTPISDAMQETLTREALRRAAAVLADHAEFLAGEMELGGLPDRGGPEAMRLFAAVVRATNDDAFGPEGHA
jgi:hypothetical protein